ncbi:28861_t:CDS:2 [Gigaspora margarita]|uniref:28861_t:CDS:1 n=1 Tax=Gigaspora margarita TaxID=4874 RepID=A0ABN7V6G2_GIGMA|nr:28861_t:CDS:2 [Gigaspora margarita]
MPNTSPSLTPSAIQEYNNNSTDMQVCTTFHTTMDLGDDDMEHATKKMKTIATPMPEVFQILSSKIAILVKEQGQLADPNKKPKLPNYLKTLKKIMDKTLSDLLTNLLIFDYNKIILTINVLHEKFDFRAAPPYLFRLLN